MAYSWGGGGLFVVVSLFSGSQNITRNNFLLVFEPGQYA